MPESKPLFRRRTLFAFSLGGLMTVFALPALAGSLDRYRAQGIIAERYDGLVEIRVSDPPADAHGIVDKVNAKRREIYRERAESQNVAPEAVSKLYAKQIWKDAPSGTYLKTPDGDYVRK